MHFDSIREYFDGGLKVLVVKEVGAFFQKVLYVSFNLALLTRCALLLLLL